MHRRFNLERARYPVVVLSASTGLVKRRKQPVALPTLPVAMVRTADARKGLRHGDRDFGLGSFASGAISLMEEVIRNPTWSQACDAGRRAATVAI